jgi:hypothetical protein
MKLVHQDRGKKKITKKNKVTKKMTIKWKQYVIEVTITTISIDDT